MAKQLGYLRNFLAILLSFSTAYSIELINTSSTQASKRSLHNPSSTKKISLDLNNYKDCQTLVGYVTTLEEVPIPLSKWPSITCIENNTKQQYHNIDSSSHRKNLIELHNRILPRVAKLAAEMVCQPPISINKNTGKISLRSTKTDLVRTRFLYEKLLHRFATLSVDNSFSKKEFIEIDPSNPISLEELLKIIKRLEEMHITNINWDFFSITNNKTKEFEKWIDTVDFQYRKILQKIYQLNMLRKLIPPFSLQTLKEAETLGKRINKLVGNDISISVLLMEKEALQQAIAKEVQGLIDRGVKGKEKEEVIPALLGVTVLPFVQEMMEKESRLFHKRILQNTLNFNRKIHLASFSNESGISENSVLFQKKFKKFINKSS